MKGDRLDPRILPLGSAEYMTRMRHPIPKRAEASPVNLMSTLAHHDTLARQWMRFALELMRGVLPERDRELLILRTGWRCRSPYEWGQHVIIAADVGLSTDEIERVALGPEDPGWDEHERALLRAADELHQESTISAPTWQALAARYDERQLIELVMIVGQYHLVAYAANALAIAPDSTLPAIPG